MNVRAEELNYQGHSFGMCEEFYKSLVEREAVAKPIVEIVVLLPVLRQVRCDQTIPRFDTGLYLVVVERALHD